MIYKQVQQSTYLLDYAGQRFLVDPIMGGLEKGAAKEEIKFSDLLDVDAVIATHLTKGAFDGEARRLIPRGMKVFVQNEADADSLSMDGFSNLEILTETTEFCHLSIRKTPAFYKVNGISTVAIVEEGKAVPVPGLIVETESEKAEWEAGEKRYQLRKQRRLEGF